ncbi:nitrile hydratase subunit alpha [Pseudorhodoplanes sp.]|uniref:nitrile hydratase subunit alpha n=1 Tax=Pseudorhodoplanes sp. TaxID=1934341 RepID=UPI003D112FB4
MGCIIARAWSDRKFHGRLMDDPRVALRELDISIPQSTTIVAVENTLDRIGLVLSAPPAAMPLSALSEIRDFGEVYRDPRLWPLNWLARDPVAARRMVTDPRRELAKLGVVVPEAMDVSFVINTFDMVHLVVPALPAGMTDRIESILKSVSSGSVPAALRFGRLFGDSAYATLLDSIREAAGSRT